MVLGMRVQPLRWLLVPCTGDEEQSICNGDYVCKAKYGDSFHHMNTPVRR